MRAFLLATLLLAGCTGAAEAERVLDRRGFPTDGAGAGLAPPPSCEAPDCWSASTGEFAMDLSADGAGGVTYMAWEGGGWDIEHTGGNTFVGAPAALMHFDAAGALNQTLGFDSHISPHDFDHTGDGGLVVALGDQVALQGVPLTGAGSVFKLDANWEVQWQVHSPSGGQPARFGVVGMPDGGALVLARTHKAVLDDEGNELLPQTDAQPNTQHGIARLGADGELIWAHRTHPLGEAAVGTDGSVVFSLEIGFGMDAPLWDGSSLPLDLGDAQEGRFVVRVDPAGDLMWVLPIGSHVTADGLQVAPTSDGGAWITPAWYRPFGANAADLTVYVGEASSTLPSTDPYAQHAAIVRLDGDGAVVSWEWPWAEVGLQEYLVGEIEDIATDVDDGLLVSGKLMAFSIPFNDLIPFDAGLTTLAGSAVGQSGDYLARVEPDGRGGWGLGHAIGNEYRVSHLATDGTHAFLDYVGPDWDGAPAGPGGPLVRIPLPPIE